MKFFIKAEQTTSSSFCFCRQQRSLSALKYSWYSRYSPSSGALAELRWQPAANGARCSWCEAKQTLRRCGAFGTRLYCFLNRIDGFFSWMWNTEFTLHDLLCLSRRLCPCDVPLSVGWGEKMDKASMWLFTLPVNLPGPKTCSLPPFQCFCKTHFKTNNALKLWLTYGIRLSDWYFSE